MVLREQKAGSYSDDDLNVVGNTPHISAYSRAKLHGLPERLRQDGRFQDLSHYQRRRDQTY